jgi:hypothetical protein
MKAQRRHELKTNTLAEAMAHLPNSGLRSAVTSILIVLAGVLIGLLIRFRISSGQDQAARAGDNLAVVREEIDELKQLAGHGVDPSQPEVLYKDIDSRLDSVLADAGSGYPQLAAEALVARGDANWNYAGFLNSTTQPSAAGRVPSDLLSAAESAYQQVLSTYPKQELSATTARFALAAIDENRHDWDGARRQYQSIIDDASAGQAFHDMATQDLSAVDQLQHPPVIAAATQTAAPGVMPKAGPQ